MKHGIVCGLLGAKLVACIVGVGLVGCGGGGGDGGGGGGAGDSSDAGIAPDGALLPTAAECKAGTYKLVIEGTITNKNSETFQIDIKAPDSGSIRANPGGESPTVIAYRGGDPSIKFKFDSLFVDTSSLTSAPGTYTVKDYTDADNGASPPPQLQPGEAAVPSVSHPNRPSQSMYYTGSARSGVVVIESFDPIGEGGEMAIAFALNLPRDGRLTGCVVAPVVGVSSSFVTSAASIDLQEGASSPVFVHLATAPAAPVTVSVASTAPATAIASPATLTFTPANWNVDQMVTVVAPQDDDTRDDSAALSLSGPGLLGGSVGVTVIDDDTQGLLLTARDVSLDEGAQAAFGAHLAFRPTADVAVSLTSNAPGDVDVSPTQLVFTATNWNVDQTVTVTSTANHASYYDRYAEMILSSSGIPDRFVGVNVRNTDQAIIVPKYPCDPVNQNPCEVLEQGGTEMIAVHLAAQPTTAVTVTATSADPTALSVAPGSLAFTPANYATDQYVTVTGGNVALGRYVDVTLASTGLTDATVSVAVIKAATFMKASVVRGLARLDELHVAARVREHASGIGPRRARR